MTESETKPPYVIVSFSGGKDSTAMLLHMIELGEHIDEVITCDTGMEFPAMYDHIAKIHDILAQHGIKHTILKSESSFEYNMIYKPFDTPKYGKHQGYGWPTPVIRWCTKNHKTKLINEYIKQLKEKYDLIQCIGLASDETKRLERDFNQHHTHRHPLVEWGWTESDCLQYCYGAGFDWCGLYVIFNRVSCWCCPLANLGELKKLWKHYPELWNQLIEWENTMDAIGWDNRPKFKGKYSVRDLTERFVSEDGMND